MEYYSAYSPDVAGCVATGDTIEEVLQAMHEALQFHLEGMVLNGEEKPGRIGDGDVSVDSEPVVQPSAA